MAVLAPAALILLQTAVLLGLIWHRDPSIRNSFRKENYR
jgi:hypothetical protein